MKCCAQSTLPIWAYVDSYELFGDRATLQADFVNSDLMAAKYSSITTQSEVSQLADKVNWTGLAPGSNLSYLVPAPEERKVKLVELPDLYDQYNVVVATSFFHLYNLGEQLELAKCIARMIKRKPGSLLVGRQIASVVPGEYNSISENKGATRFAHDDATW